MGVKEFLEGAGGGALAGGSLGGPWGAVAGGALGGIAGLFGGDNGKKEERKRLDALYNDVKYRPDIQLGAAQQAQGSAFRDNQRNLVNHLEAMSRGRGPSLASEQFKASTDRNIAQQQGLALSGQGNATAAAMMAANNSANLGAQASQGAAAARIAEQQAALNQLGLTLQGARGMDEEQNRFNTSQMNQFQLSQLEAQLRQRGMSDSAILAILGKQAQSNQGPTLGQSILSGGAGLYSMYATNKAQNRGNG